MTWKLACMVAASGFVGLFEAGAFGHGEKASLSFADVALHVYAVADKFHLLSAWGDDDAALPV